MIYIQDNFLPNVLYKSLLGYCNEFSEVKYPDKSFWVKELPKQFEYYMISELERLRGNLGSETLKMMMINVH